MVTVHSEFLEELKEYFDELPETSNAEKHFVSMINSYFNNQGTVDDYEASVHAFLSLATADRVN